MEQLPDLLHMLRIHTCFRCFQQRHHWNKSSLGVSIAFEPRLPHALGLFRRHQLVPRQEFLSIVVRGTSRTRRKSGRQARTASSASDVQFVGPEAWHAVSSATTSLEDSSGGNSQIGFFAWDQHIAKIGWHLKTSSGAVVLACGQTSVLVRMSQQS